MRGIVPQSKGGWQTFTETKMPMTPRAGTGKCEEASAESAEVGRFLKPQLRFNVRFHRSDVRQGGGESINFALCGSSLASLATGVPFARCSVPGHRIRDWIDLSAILRRLVLSAVRQRMWCGDST